MMRHLTPIRVLATMALASLAGTSAIAAGEFSAEDGEEIGGVAITPPPSNIELVTVCETASCGEGQVWNMVTCSCEANIVEEESEGGSVTNLYASSYVKRSPPEGVAFHKRVRETSTE